MTSDIQKSTKIAWTLVTLLIGGIILWNLNTASSTGRWGTVISLVIVTAIVGIWRWDPKEENKDT